MGWPQYTLLALTLFGLGIAIAKDGEPRTGNHSFIIAIISNAIVLWLLYAGGFFS